MGSEARGRVAARPDRVLRLFATYGAQAIQRFELVHQLPLTLGLVLDTSGSMRESLIEAKAAATDFLAGVMTPRDRCFAVAFAERPGLLMPPTSDAHALETAFRDLPALGNTSLHDALVYSLYQYRGVRGRKAMVVLSDEGQAHHPLDSFAWGISPSSSSSTRPRHTPGRSSAR